VTGYVAYLDTSAALKLLVAEAETDALERALSPAGGWTSSTLLVVELRSATDRLAPSVLKRDRVDDLLNRCTLIAVDDGVIERASAGFRPPQRALDAVHLATAIELGLPDLRFYSYDRQQLKAARKQRLSCASPGRR
jgi:predicted nucleic acid-binding protein